MKSQGSCKLGKLFHKNFLAALTLSPAGFFAQHRLVLLSLLKQAKLGFVTSPGTTGIRTTCNISEFLWSIDRTLHQKWPAN